MFRLGRTAVTGGPALEPRNQIIFEIADVEVTSHIRAR